MDHSSMAGGFQPGLGTPVWSPNLTPMSEPQYIGALIGLFLLSIGFRALMAAQGYLEAYLHLHYYPRPIPPPQGSSRSSRQRQDHQYQQQEHPVLPPRVQNGSVVVSEDSLTTPELDEKNDQEIGTTPTQAHPAPSGTTFPDPPVPAFATDSLPPPPGLRARLGNKPPLYHHHHHQYRASHSRPLQQQQQQQQYLTEPSSSGSFLFPLPTVQPFVWQAEISRAVLTTAVVGIGYMLMLVIMTYNSAYFGVILAGIFVGEVYFGRWGRVRPIFPTTAHSARPLPTSTVLHPANINNNNNNNTASIPNNHHHYNNTTTSSRLAHYAQHPASSSVTSVASRASSHGYSAMVHHSAAADGGC